MPHRNQLPYLGSQESKKAIAEISGRDSVAAVLKFCQENKVEEIAPTYVHTSTEYGDFGKIERNVELLRKGLKNDFNVHLSKLTVLSNPQLWWAINGRFITVLFEKFGFYTPCIGCHLYVHLMRVPLARQLGLSQIIAGEREVHQDSTKLSQTAETLDAYIEVLNSFGLKLIFPLRNISSNKEIEEIIKPLPIGGKGQLECVLKANYRSLSDKTCYPAGKIHSYINNFLIPAGKKLLRELLGERKEFVRIVEEILGETEK